MKIPSNLFVEVCTGELALGSPCLGKSQGEPKSAVDKPFFLCCVSWTELLIDRIDDPPWISLGIVFVFSGLNISFICGWDQMIGMHVDSHRHFLGPEVLAPCMKHVSRSFGLSVVSFWWGPMSLPRPNQGTHEFKHEIFCQDPGKSNVCFIVELRSCILQAFVSWGLKAHVESRWEALGGWAVPNDLDEGNKWKLERTTFK